MIVFHLSKCSLAIRTVSLMHKHLSVDLTAFSLIFQQNKKERDWGRLLSLNVKSPSFNFDEGCQREGEKERGCFAFVHSVKANHELPNTNKFML